MFRELTGVVLSFPYISNPVGMNPSGAESEIQRKLTTALAELTGVRRAIVSGPPWRALLICEHGIGSAADLRAAALQLMSAKGAQGGELEISFVAPPRTRTRVRFVECSFELLGPAHAAGRVVLEWEGESVEMAAEGETGPMAMLRLPAIATLRALGHITTGNFEARLVGVKQVRVFDGDMIVVLLHSPQAPHRQMIGACLVTDQPARAAALAVLNATNRVMGNYLAISD